jgi:hypothetical protein
LRVEPRVRPRATRGKWAHGTTFIAASLALSCAGAPFPRETRAFDGRTDDPWLEGERCPAGPRDDTGLRIEEVEAGSGKVAGDGETVRVHYVAKLPDGTIVHDTRHDGPPVEVIIGSTKMICGFDRALLGMRAGEQRRVSVPWRLAFGESGRPPDVQPRTDLVFVIDLFVPAYRGVEQTSRPTNPASRGRGR